jgi:deoxyribodipyrimidine photo-lyase
MENNVLVWFRNDLRLHDNEALYKAINTQRPVLAIYIFDENQYKSTHLGFPKTGSFRAKFIIESVQNLKENLKGIGVELLVFKGNSAQIISNVCKEFSIIEIYHQQENTDEEIQVEKILLKSLYPSVQLKGNWGKTLFHVNNIPFTINQLPEIFTNFRKKAEAHSEVNQLFSNSLVDNKLIFENNTQIPSIGELGLPEVTINTKAAIQFKGGETEALNRLNHYFFETKCLATYKITRNEMLGPNYSSKFSAWLALGCISPRYIYHQIKLFESQIEANDSTYWLFFELLWRDYFQFVALKHGNKLFKLTGLNDLKIAWKNNKTDFEKWKLGQTGFPLIDANMQELLQTGFMSNRGRQNVASFLTKNLGINWLWGAKWFESLLVDYDASSNYGNWAYQAGVGNDARQSRFFNIEKQSLDYDSKGNYVRHWLDELKNLPNSKALFPYKLSIEEQKRFNFKAKVQYYEPMVGMFG